MMRALSFLARRVAPVTALAAGRGRTPAPSLRPTTRPNRNPKGVDEDWDAVKAFPASLALSSISPSKDHS
jgi:hypothetical protein